MGGFEIEQIKDIISKTESDENSTDCSTQSSPRGVLEIQTSSTQSINGNRNDRSSSIDKPTIAGRTQPAFHSSQWKNFIANLLPKKKKFMARFPTFPPDSRSVRNFSGILPTGEEQCMIGIVLPMNRPSWRNFDLQELELATDNFSHENLIGKGGHAEVYKGCLHDGQIVAVKRLTKKGKEEERISDFLSELGIICHVQHPNAAQLVGFGVEGGLHMVLQFSPHGSLAHVLHGSKISLKWKDRLSIALGIAEGLCYLHEGCKRRIIHRDIKASNILLNEGYKPQISDFGLAKWLPDKWTHHAVFPIEGTFGYMAPEYFMYGVVNEKIDVFAFGVLLLELITGRRAVDSARRSLVMWAKPFIEANDSNGLIDPSIRVDANPEELKRLVLIASMCIHHSPTSRPTMNMVVRLLKGEVGTLEFTGRASSKPRPPLLDSGEIEEYTRSRYLSDLHRHKELALEQWKVD